METTHSVKKKRSKRDVFASEESKIRYEAYSRLQAAAVAFGEHLPIPEIVAIGGQSDGKSSLLEAFLGFRHAYPSDVTILPDRNHYRCFAPQPCLSPYNDFGNSTCSPGYDWMGTACVIQLQRSLSIQI